jgi:hypothetical protein
MTATSEVLDRIFEAGIMFVSSEDILVPIRRREDVRETGDGELEIHFHNGWIPVPIGLMKYVKRH